MNDLLFDTIMHLNNAVIISVCIIASCIQCSCYVENVTREPRKPFYMDSYEECVRNNKVYCKVIANLLPKTGQNDSYIWETPPPSIREDIALRPDRGFYGFCIDADNGLVDKNTIFSHCDNFLRDKKYYGEVTYYGCESPVYGYLGMQDVFVCIVYLLYLSVVIYATKMDTKWQTHPPENVPRRVQTVCEALSFKRNLKSLFANDNRIQDTKAIQGLRVLVMLGVIFVHCLLTYASNFLKNFEDLEETMSKPFFHYFVSPMLLHSVQAFFFISGFLLAIQTNELNDANKCMRLKDIFVMILNRFARLVVPIAAAVLIMLSSLTVLSAKGVNFDVFETELRNCRNFWWPTILLMHNNFPQDGICSAGYWYVSADFQLYAISLILIYLMLRFKKYSASIFAVFVTASVILQMYIMYIKETNTVLGRGLKDYRWEIFSTSVDFRYWYISTTSNINSYLVGVGFGFIYYRNKGKIFFKDRFTVAIWWMISSMLTFLVCYVATQQFSGMSKLVLGSISKPLYTATVGIAILNVLFRTAETLRSILEHRIFQVLAKVTYSTYIFHFPVVFARLATTTEFIEFTGTGLILGYLSDATLGILFGTTMYLLVESPALKLQKMFLPQVRKHSKVENGVPNSKSH